VTRYQKWISFGLGGLILCLLPLWLSSYFISILIFIGIYAIAALGLGLLIGYAGQLSLGHNAFFGLGAYTSAILSFRYGLSPWLGILSGMVLTGTVAYLIGKPVLRFRGHMLAIVTIAIGLIFWGLFGEMDFITGGYEGFSRVPRPSIGTFTFTKDIHFYYLVLVILAILFKIALNIAKSKIGNEFRTIDLSGGGSEIAAQTLGVNIGKIKTQVFVLSTVYASIGGSLYVHYLTHIDPTPFNLWTAFLLVIMVVIGGMRSLWGPIIGAVFYVGLKELISYAMPVTQSVALAGFEVILFSLLFIVALLIFPDGLVRLPAILCQHWTISKKPANFQEAGFHD
jgi:branched-chain amino acid transport system permease protein